MTPDDALDLPTITRWAVRLPVLERRAYFELRPRADSPDRTEWTLYSPELDQLASGTSPLA